MDYPACSKGDSCVFMHPVKPTHLPGDMGPPPLDLMPVPTLSKPPLGSYTAEREANISRNRKLLAELGLLNNTVPAKRAIPKAKPASKKKATKENIDGPAARVTRAGAAAERKVKKAALVTSKRASTRVRKPSEK